jgi:hypothetical protein
LHRRFKTLSVISRLDALRSGDDAVHSVEGEKVRLRIVAANPRPGAHEVRLDDNEISISGARRADVTDLGAPQHLGDGSGFPQSVESDNLSLEICSIGWTSVLSSQRKTCKESTKGDLGE